MKDLVLRAEAIARAAHDGQVDKAGMPYADHPARVARRCAPDVDAMAVAWLHDVLEDTAVTAETLRAHGIPEHVVTAVAALTREEGEAAAAYYERVARNRLALTVKWADLADNGDPGRLAALAIDDPATAARLQAKYAHAREVLTHLSQQAPGTR